jgi:hypothetical protein
MAALTLPGDVKDAGALFAFREASRKASRRVMAAGWGDPV